MLISLSSANEKRIMSRFQNCPKVVGKDCNWYKTKRMQINNSRDFICILSGIVILLCIFAIIKHLAWINLMRVKVDTLVEKLFLEKGTLKVLKKNEYMVRQNDKTNHIGFVTSGTFRLTRIDTNGNEWIVGYSFENDFVCDYPSLINRTSATVSIKATTDCEVYLLPLSELNQF